MQLRNAVSQLLLDVPDLVCRVTAFRASALSRAARWARICSAKAESPVSAESVSRVKIVLNFELLLLITKSAQNPDSANINVPQIIPNKIKSFEFTVCAIFYFIFVHAVL